MMHVNVIFIRGFVVVTVVDYGRDGEGEKEKQEIINFKLPF